MVLDYSKKRYTNIIAGILIVFLVSIFLVCALGVWDHDVFSENDIRLHKVDISEEPKNIMKKNHKNDFFPGVELLPIAEKCCKSGMSTEKGWVRFDGHNIPDVLPTVLTEAEVGTWYVTIYAFGGYTFEGGYLDIYQWKDDIGVVGSLNLVNDGVGSISVGTLETNLGIDTGLPDDLMVDVITMGFEMIDGDLDGDLSDEYIELLANQYPEVFGPCWVYDDNPICTPCSQNNDFMKLVKFKVTTDWEGCPKPDQKFQIILAYDCMLRSPQLPINNFIAS